MFQSKKLIAVTVVLLGCLAWGGLAYAQWPGTQRRPEMFLKHLAVVLDLSDAQATQIRSIWEEKMQAAKPLLMEAHQAHQAIQQAIESGKTDAATLKPLTDQIGSTVSQLGLLRAQAAAAVYPILTPEQREKAKKIHSLLGERARQFLMQ